MALAKSKNIRLEIRAHVAHSKFPIKRRRLVEGILVRAIRYYRILTRRPPKIVSNSSHNAKSVRSRGRPNLSEQRNFLMSELFRAWVVGFKLYPTINNKLYGPSPFVKFCEPILRREGIGRVLDHLEKYRAYRKRVIEKYGFKVIRGKVY